MPTAFLLEDRLLQQIFDDLYVVRDARVVKVLIVPELHAAVSSRAVRHAGAASPLSNVCSRNHTYGRSQHSTGGVWWRNSQDRDNGLAVLPAQFLNVPNGRDQITSAARTHKQAIPLDEEPSHTDRLGVRYPDRRKAKRKKKDNQRQSFLY